VEEEGFKLGPNTIALLAFAMFPRVGQIVLAFPLKPKRHKFAEIEIQFD
jgi:hypothetical protein